MSSNNDARFLRVLGFGRDEALWITQYDTWPVRGGFRCKFKPVGRDPPTCSFCGKHRSFFKCSNVASHDGVFKGMDIWHNVVLSCHRPSCCLCWKYGWAVRAGHNVDSRFLTADKVLGLRYEDVEHVFASVPQEEYPLGFLAWSRNAILALKGSGVTGGCTIFHAFRKDKEAKELFLSPHFHSLCYIDGGYDRCRECIKPASSCWHCDGFEGRTRRAHVNDRWVVGLAKNENGKVEKRENIFGTAWYQLEHAGLMVGVQRFQVVRWFGSVNNRKLKTVHQPLEHKCRVCGEPMEKGYLGDNVRIVANRGERGFLKDFAVEHVDDENDMSSERRSED